jgi:hypothetical protein
MNQYLKTQPYRPWPSKFNNMKFQQSRAWRTTGRKAKTAILMRRFDQHLSLLSVRFQFVRIPFSNRDWNPNPRWQRTPLSRNPLHGMI